MFSLEFVTIDHQIISELSNDPIELRRYLSPRFETARQVIAELRASKSAIARTISTLSSTNVVAQAVLEELDPGSSIQSALGVTPHEQS